MPLGEGNTVLVEFEPDVAYVEILNVLRAIRALGYRPLVAHVERYDCLRRKPERVRELVSGYNLVQVNAASIMAGYFSPVRRFVYRLLRAGLVHVVSTDKHSDDRRSPGLRDAYRRVAALCGTASADLLFYLNPCEIISTKEPV